MKPLASELSLPLQIFLKQLLETSVFPEIWISPLATPILKCGDRFIYTNYCAIAILSLIPKLFEKLFYAEQLIECTVTNTLLLYVYCQEM